MFLNYINPLKESDVRHFIGCSLPMFVLLAKWRTYYNRFISCYNLSHYITLNPTIPCTEIHIDIICLYIRA